MQTSGLEWERLSRCVSEGAGGPGAARREPGRSSCFAGSAWGSSRGGVVIIALGWNEMARVTCVDCQFPYLLSAGAGGLGAMVVGVGLLIVPQIRAERVRLFRRLERTVASGTRSPQDGRAGDPSDGQTVEVADCDYLGWASLSSEEVASDEGGRRRWFGRRYPPPRSGHDDRRVGRGHRPGGSEPHGSPGGGVPFRTRSCPPPRSR